MVKDHHKSPFFLFLLFQVVLMMYKFNIHNTVRKRKDQSEDGGGGAALPKIIPKNPPPSLSPLLPVLEPDPPSLKPGYVMLMPLSLRQPTKSRFIGVSVRLLIGPLEFFFFLLSYSFGFCSTRQPTL